MISILGLITRCFFFTKPMIVFLLLVISLNANAVKSHPNKIDIKFYVLTENKEANAFFTEVQASKIMDNLSSGFKDQAGKKLVRFDSLGLTRYEDIKNSKCALIGYGTQTKKPNKAKMISSYLSCKDSKLRSRRAVNFYIFDSPWQGHEKWKTSYAYFDGESSPAVLVNWETLKSGYKTPDIHEMGHVFGLDHTPACGSNDDTPTYAMASVVESCKGTGGNRKLGFKKDEIETIKETSDKLFKVLSQ